MLATLSMYYTGAYITRICSNAAGPQNHIAVARLFWALDADSRVDDDVAVPVPIYTDVSRHAFIASVTLPSVSPLLALRGVALILDHP
jgi:hypothetical protein